MSTSSHFWVGGYSGNMGGLADGIGLARVRPDDGRLEFLAVAVETSSPSFLVDGVADGVIYSTDEAGRVEAFRRGDGFTLQPLGGQATSGANPCHASATVDRLFVSNYGDGSIDVFPLGPTGEIGPLCQTLAGSRSESGPDPAQDGSHAHSTLVGKTILSVDLGTDEVHVHSLKSGRLVRRSTVSLPAGSGPRDLRASRGGALVLGELSGTVFALDSSGAVTASGSLVDDWIDGDHAAAIAVEGTGRFLYSGLRGSNRVAVVGTDDLVPVAAVWSGGDWPRHLCVSGGFLYVANQLSHSVASFRIDPVTGIPRQIGEAEPVASPTYLLPVR